MKNVIELQNVTKDYGSGKGVFDVSFSVKEGEVFGSRNWITPAFELEKYFFPQADGIIDVISEKLLPLPGRVCTINETELEHMDRSKKGL